MIEVKNLSKRFRHPPAKGKPAPGQQIDPRALDGWFHSVRDVSFHCAAGEVLGLLGPNGAGKTTTLRLLSSALAPDSGSAHVNGFDVLADPVQARKRIGFLSGSTGLYGRLTARENIEYFGRLHGIPKADLRRRCDELIEQLDMESFAQRRVEQLSTGMRQRCAIARAVVHRPEAVILDEPTTGLDVMAAKTLLDFIASYKALAIPLIFSTHHLHEVEALCDRVCVINQGSTAFHGTLAELRLLGAKGGKGGEGGDLYHAYVSVVNGGVANGGVANCGVVNCGTEG